MKKIAKSSDLFLGLVAFAYFYQPTVALMGSMVGARILFRLDDNFEQNNKIIFSFRSVFDKSDGMTDASGIVFTLLSYPKGPSLNYADKFGVLQITSGAYISTYPNNFTVILIDGDYIEGEMDVEYILPPGSALRSIYLPKSRADALYWIRDRPDYRHSCRSAAVRGSARHGPRIFCCRRSTRLQRYRSFRPTLSFSRVPGSLPRCRHTHRRFAVPQLFAPRRREQIRRRLRRSKSCQHSVAK